MTGRPHGWFSIPGLQTGDRTIEQQLTGLSVLLEHVSGQTVLDLGCAEGLIAKALVRAGAACVYGVDSVIANVHAATIVCDRLPCFFATADLNDLGWEPPATDVVLMLGVLHKLTDPAALVSRILPRCRAWAVVRLPPGRGATIIDARSAHVPHDMNAAFESAGFRLVRQDLGPFDEWVGYFTRVRG